MFIVNDKSFRKRELGRLRAEKFRKARHELSNVEQFVLINNENNANINSSDIEMPDNLLLMNKKQSDTPKNIGNIPRNSKYPKRSSKIDKSRGSKRKRSSSAESLSKSVESTNSSSCEESVVEKYKKLNSKCITNSISSKSSRLNSDKSENDSESETDHTVHKNKPLNNN
ncbi:uncharacterized protein LOC141537895 [Cotesia typhae]|uniref:uncharacterized protein LOC141537895 n=1 Tax=Cotesia typhae TaxID=2053667 RepID=UPI003D691147